MFGNTCQGQLTIWNGRNITTTEVSYQGDNDTGQPLINMADDSSFRLVQLSTFAILFSGYASYNYNRKSVSFALPSLISNGLLDKSGAGN